MTMRETDDDTTHSSALGEARYWLDDRRNVDRIVYGLYGICALLLAIDVLIPKHGPFAIEHFWGFYGIYGFVACVGLVLAARLMRRVLMRPEDYYDR
jgi:hypothetical protein